jgi:GTPase SAR1 family protein
MAKTAPLCELKIVVLGDGRVGKTQLVRRLRELKFQRESTSTPDFEVHALQLLGVGPKGKDVTARVFDFGGQPHLWSAHRFFLASRHNLYIVVIDGTRQNMQRMKYWLDYIRHYTMGRAQGCNAGDSGWDRTERIPVLVVFSQCDRRKAEPSEDRHAFATITASQARKFCGDCLDFAHLKIVPEYSSADGTGMAKVKESIRELLLSMEYVFGTQYPKAFHLTKAWLQGDINARHRLSEGEFKRSLSLGKLKDVFRKAQEELGDEVTSEAYTLWVEMLRNLGVLHWIGDLAGVKLGTPVADTVYHTDWVRDLVYSIIRATPDIRQGGVADEYTLCRLMCEACQECGEVEAQVLPCQRQLLELMEASHLIFRDRRLSDAKRWLVLDWVKDEQVIDTTELVETSRICFRFLPESLLLHFAGEWFGNVQRGRPEDFCRNQLRLRDFDSADVNVVVVADTTERVISILSSGNDTVRRSAFAEVVRGAIRRLADTEGLSHKQEGWINANEYRQLQKVAGSSVPVRVEYFLHKPWFRCGEGIPFDEAWERFCCTILEEHHNEGCIDWRRPKDDGVDLFHASKKIAYQCKSVESGRDGDFNTSRAIASLRTAITNRERIGWEEYILCTNVELTGRKQNSLRKQMAEIVFYTRHFWEGFCRRNPQIAADWFRVPVDVELLVRLGVTVY